jgi:hypothetical protein
MAPDPLAADSTPPEPTPLDPTPPDPTLPDPLEVARRALDHGDYGRVIRQLEPLVEQYPPRTPVGAQLQLLMATAWMGQGQSQRAISCCQRIRACGDGAVRAQVRELLAVLEAPVLRRPREWSLTLPALGEAPPLEGRVKGMGRRRRRPQAEEPPPPPVGPTRPPVGFALVVLAVLAGLAFLLGGCVQVRAELQFQGPGRLQVGFEQHAQGGRPSPWQQQFAERLRHTGFRADGAGAEPRWLSPVLPASTALDLLAGNLEQAAHLAGVSLPPPRLQLQERNWLVGVWQQLQLDLDLREIDNLPGVDLALELQPLRPGAVQRAEPQAVRPAGPAPAQRLHWPLQLGSRNRLELRCWRWSPLGLGSVLIALALALVSMLTALRRRLGFGLPELPA